MVFPWLNKSYACINPLKKVVNLLEGAASLHEKLPVTCMYNGKYDIDVKTYGCTGKFLGNSRTVSK